MGWWIILILLVVLVVLVFGPRLAEARRLLPDQRKAPGEMVRLTDGATHALWHGPSRGPVIVAIHGISTPLPLWDLLAPELADLGYRVLTYDLYGRGYSDNTDAEQGPDLFIRQLDGLLDHYGIAEDITLVGHSLGGAIATAWAAARPGRVKRLVLIAASGIEVTNPRGLRHVIETPGLGDWLFGLGAPRILRRSLAVAPSLVRLCRGELRRRGFLPAVLSSLRHMARLRQEGAHRTIAAAGIPVVAIWGDQDPTVPRRAPGTLVSWNRAAKQEMIAGGGHYLPVTHADEVAVLLRDILREDWQ